MTYLIQKSINIFGAGAATQTALAAIVSVRYQMLVVTRQAVAIATYQQTLDWQAYGSHTPAGQLNLKQALLTYRDE